MQQVMTERKEIKLIGISVRTNNKDEADKLNGKIFPCIRRYYHESLGEQIPNRAKKGTTFCAYTDYESDYNGPYTYFIGEEVTSLDKVPAGFQTLVIPAQKYVKFTNGPAPMPEVIVDAWEKIWKMTPKELGGKRAYKTDFEIYDERANDHQKIVLDVYIGLLTDGK